MTLPDVDWVFGPQQLIGCNQPHVLFHHEVLDNTGGSQGEAIPTVNQDSLPFLSRSIDALIDVLKTALFQCRPIPKSIWHITDVHLKAGPAVAGPTGAGAWYEAEAGAQFTRYIAHVNDAVDVVATKGSSVVRCIQVPNKDVVCHLGDDGFRVLKVFWTTGFGLRYIRSSGSSWPCGGSPAVVAQLFGARAGWRVGVRL